MKSALYKSSLCLKLAFRTATELSHRCYCTYRPPQHGPPDHLSIILSNTHPHTYSSSSGVTGSLNLIFPFLTSHPSLCRGNSAKLQKHTLERGMSHTAHCPGSKSPHRIALVPMMLDDHLPFSCLRVYQSSTYHYSN